MKRIIVLTVLLVTAGFAFAQRDAAGLVTRVLDTYGKDPNGAITLLMGTNPMFEELQGERAQDLRKQIRGLHAAGGEYIGYEIISIDEYGTHLARVVAVLLYQNRPVGVRLVLYKAQENWRMEDVEFGYGIVEDLKSMEREPTSDHK